MGSAELSPLLLVQAAEHYNAGRPQQASALCADILVAHPHHLPALHLASVIALAEGRMEEGRKLLHELMDAPCPAYPSGTYPGWLHPGTDYLASFAPFNSLPTQCRVTIDGQQKWFAQ